MPECPTCEDVLDTEHGLKIHHTRVHGESLVLKECERCGDDFKPSHSTKQRFCSPECASAHQSDVRSEEWQGEGHPHWDTEKGRECEWCGESATRPDTRFCSQECHHEWRKAEWEPVRGESHPNYVHGEGSDLDYGKNWSRKRAEARERDEVCQICDEDGSEHLLDVHHIQPLHTFEHPEDANVLSNLVLLCRPCHHAAEHGRTQKLLRRASSYEAMRNITPAETTGEA